MKEMERNRLLRPEQGVTMAVDTKSGEDKIRVEIDATDTETVLKGLGLLVIQLAEVLGVRAEKVLAVLAVTVMQIGERMNAEDEKEE